MSDTFGPGSPRQLAFYDHDSSCWRMWPAISLWGSQRFSGTLPSSGMTRGGRLYELPMSARATDGPASSSSPALPTPTAGDAASSGSRNLPGSKAHAGVSLTDVFRTGDSTTSRKEIQYLPTPNAQESDPTDDYIEEMRDHFDPGERMYLPGRKWHGQRTLSRVATMLPTPTSREHKGRNQRDDETCLPGAVGNLAARSADASSTSTSPPGSVPDPAAGSAPTVADGSRTPLLPTPEASDATGGRRSKELGGKRPSGAKRAITLATALDHGPLLPTPRHSPQENRTTKRTPGQMEGRHGLYLSAEVAMVSRGEPTDRPSPATSASSDDRPLTLWTDEDG